MNNKGRLLLGCVLLVSSCYSSAITLIDQDSRRVELNLEMTMAPLYSSYHFGKREERTVKWLEGFIKGGITFESTLHNGTLYGNASVFSSRALGDGDAAGTSFGNESYTKLDNAYLGFKTQTYDISVGRQFYLMGDSFLIAGDQLNYGDALRDGTERSGLYYLARPSTFANTVLVKLHPNEAMKLELFHLESENAGQGNPILNGFNWEFSGSETDQIALSYFRVANVDKTKANGRFALREGLNVYNIRGKTSLGVDGLDLSAGYVKEASSQVDAEAWYAGAEFTFKDWAFTPTIGYRYAYFSGDDPDTAKSNAFDAMFYGPSKNDTAWVQGEVGGTFAGPFNTNLRSQRIFGRLQISETVAVSTRLYRFNEARSGKHVSDEIDFYLETFPAPNIMVMPVLGFWKPYEGARDTYGVDSMQLFFGAIASVSF